MSSNIDRKLYEFNDGFRKSPNLVEYLSVVEVWPDNYVVPSWYYCSIVLFVLKVGKLKWKDREMTVKGRVPDSHSQAYGLRMASYFIKMTEL